MYSVAIANELIRDIRPADSKSCLVLSPMEFRIKYMMISLIQKDNFEFDSIYITVSEFAKFFDLSWGGEQTKNLKIAVENMINSYYVVDDVTVKWLSDESYFSDNKIHLKLDSSLVPYLLQLDNQFTLYNYESVSKFKSKYSYRLYEFLKSAEGMGFYKISLDDAISLLGDGCCKTKSEFIKRVLTPALNDINTYSDIRIKKRFHQPFGKPEQIWFSIRNKDDKDTSKNIKYQSRSTADMKKNEIKDENLIPVAVAMDEKTKQLIADAKREFLFKSGKTKPRRFMGGVQSNNKRKTKEFGDIENK